MSEISLMEPTIEYADDIMQFLKGECNDQDSKNRKRPCQGD